MRKSKWLIEREFQAALDNWEKSVAHMGKALALAAFTLNQQADLIEQLVAETSERAAEQMRVFAEQNPIRKAE